jgi:uncharacterized protein YjiS (DUF1127 family)
MTLEEMQQTTINHWQATEPQKLRRWKRATVEEQSRGCAELTRMEMNALKLIGVSEEEAWMQSRRLFCLVPMPNLAR